MIHSLKAKKGKELGVRRRALCRNEVDNAPSPLNEQEKGFCRFFCLSATRKSKM
jgi:hypothetical protein